MWSSTAARARKAEVHAHRPHVHDLVVVVVGRQVRLPRYQPRQHAERDRSRDHRQHPRPQPLHARVCAYLRRHGRLWGGAVCGAGGGDPALLPVRLFRVTVAIGFAVYSDSNISLTRSSPSLALANQASPGPAEAPHAGDSWDPSRSWPRGGLNPLTLFQDAGPG